MGKSAEEMMRDRLPDTTPADTPATPAGQPAGAAPPETRTFAGGKYKTIEELEGGYAEAQRKISEYGERMSRLESLLLAGGQAPAGGYDPYAQTYGTAPPQTPPVGYEEGQWVSREEAAKIAREEVGRVATETSRFQAQQAQLSSEQTYWKDEFFRRYPDLKDEAPLVAGITTEVVQRYSHLPAQSFRAMIPSILDEVAGKSRERIAGYVSRGKTEAERAAAAQAAGQVPGQMGPITPPGSTKEPTYEERVAEGIREEHEAYNRSRRPLGR